MKLMIRNLLYLFKRFKTAVVLNLFGLTIAFAAFLLIVMQVDYEMNYDAMHSKSGRTFRLEANHGEFEHNAIHCLMFSDAFVNSSAHITDYSYLIHSTEENGIANRRGRRSRRSESI